MQCTSSLGMDIDCQFMAQHFPMNLKFDPKLPHKISVFIDSPKCRFTLFRKKGKMVILGGKTINDASKACEHLVEEIKFWANLLDHQMVNVVFNHPTINNIVTSGFLGSGINLQRMGIAFDNDKNAVYELDQFPAMRYRLLENTNIKSSIFWSGKFILTGAKKQTDIDKAYEKLKQITRPYLIDPMEWE